MSLRLSRRDPLGPPVLPISPSSLTPLPATAGPREGKEWRHKEPVESTQSPLDTSCKTLKETREPQDYFRPEKPFRVEITVWPNTLYDDSASINKSFMSDSGTSISVSRSVTSRTWCASKTGVPRTDIVSFTCSLVVERILLRSTTISSLLVFAPPVSCPHSPSFPLQLWWIRPLWSDPECPTLLPRDESLHRDSKI